MKLDKHRQFINTDIERYMKKKSLIVSILIILISFFALYKVFSSSKSSVLSNLSTETSDLKEELKQKLQQVKSSSTSETQEKIDHFEKTEFKGKIAFERDRDIWSADADGSNEKRLTTYRGLWSPYFSPDGQWIAYSSIPKEFYGEGVAPTPSNIWIITPDGENYKKLSKKYRVSTEVTWSPDSKKIAIATSDSTIVVFDINTGEELEFVNDAGPLGVTPYKPLWLTETTFLYFRKLVDSATSAGLAIADIKTKEIEWLSKKPGIQQLAVSNNGEKIFYLIDNEFYQIDLSNKEELKLDWEIPDNVSFIADFKILKDSNIFMAPVHIDEKKLYPGSHIDFILINTISGESVLKRTGLQYKKNLTWNSDGYWLILNAVSPNDDVSSVWKLNLETEKKDQVIHKAYSASWSF
ncbi:MAG: hypothetical protein PVJ09_02035 [Candidatus Woesebacteria bacterium]|jgi:WD40 repeat protein